MSISHVDTTCTQMTDSDWFEVFGIDVGKLMVPDSLRVGLAYGTNYIDPNDGRIMTFPTKELTENQVEVDIDKLKERERQQRLQAMIAAMGELDEDEVKSDDYDGPSLVDYLVEPVHTHVGAIGPDDGVPASMQLLSAFEADNQGWQDRALDTLHARRDKKSLLAS